MKKIFSLIAVLALWYNVNSQTVIKNNSFEMWTTVVGQQFPDNWGFDSTEVINGSIQKVSQGSSGSSAVRLGVYNDQGVLRGAFLQYSDTGTVIPGSLSFDYRIFNMSGNIDFERLYVDVYFDDSCLIRERFTFSIEKNTGSYNTATMDLTFPAGCLPFHYRIKVGLFTLTGNQSTFAIVDNFRFGNNTSIESIGATQKVNIWPNPATNLIHISNLTEGVKTVNLISVDGKRIELVVENSTIDISGFNTGIYIIEIVGTDGSLIKREKISIKG